MSSRPSELARASLIRRWCGWLGCALSLVAPVAGHDLALTEATLVVRTDRSWTLDLVVDVDALALGVGPSAPATEVAARLVALPADQLEEALGRAEGALLRRVRVFADGDAMPMRLSFPGRGTGTARGEPTVFGLTARFDGVLPEAGAEVSVKLSRGLPPMVLTVLDGIGLGGSREAVEHGGESSRWVLGTAAPASGRPSWLEYLWLGVLHIVPRGLDHVLFVLGLFLLSARLAPLLWQVSAFTLAHTLTLALATLGLVQLPSRVVEASIAASIAWVGAVVVWRVWRNRPSESGLMARVAVVFACGLLHGLGFAGVLGDVGLPEGELVPALIGFNVGVELGQLLVIGTAAVSIGLLRPQAWYPRRVALPLGVVITAAGLFWTVERLA